MRRPFADPDAAARSWSRLRTTSTRLSSWRGTGDDFRAGIERAIAKGCGGMRAEPT